MLISATATCSESAQTQMFGHKPTQSKKVQMDIHSKKNIFLQILESCIYVLSVVIPHYLSVLQLHMVKLILYLFSDFSVIAPKTFPLFQTPLESYAFLRDPALITELRFRSCAMTVVRIAIQLKAHLSPS